MHLDRASWDDEASLRLEAIEATAAVALTELDRRDLLGEALNREGYIKGEG
jgi:hypothetical protein